MNGWALVEESTKRNLEGATAEFDVALSKAVIDIGDASIKNVRVISDQCNTLRNISDLNNSPSTNKKIKFQT